MTWGELLAHLNNDWAGADGERARLLMRSIPRYGSGGSLADDYAVRISRLFTQLVKASPTPHGYNMIPGLFSWANTIPMGKELGATPNGRHAGAPISHGSNPDPGFRQDGAPTAMAGAIDWDIARRAAKRELQRQGINREPTEREISSIFYSM